MRDTSGTDFYASGQYPAGLDDHRFHTNHLYGSRGIFPGSVSQVRECSAAILKYAKESGVPVLLIGHINKEGSIAGPKVLEHIVDTVLQFEGDQHYMYRILRSIKNRFGSTAELGIYEMRQNGLREVSNPSELLLTQNHEGLSGVAIAAAIEGVRPFLIETQAWSARRFTVRRNVAPPDSIYAE